MYRSDRSQNPPLFWPRPYAPQNRALARHGQRQQRAVMAELPQRMADAGLPTIATDPDASKASPHRRRSQTMRRMLILLFLLALIAVVAPKGPHKGPERTALANGTVSDLWRQPEPVHAVQIPRGSNGGFAVQARITGLRRRWWSIPGRPPSS